VAVRPVKLTPLALFVLLSGSILSMVDSSVVNVAVPDISADLGAPLTDVQWAVSGYLLALAATLPATAYLGRRFGSVRAYAASVAAFTIASVGCALAQNVPELVGARVVQGIAAAPLVPLSLNLIFGNGDADNVPVSAGLVLFLGPALGPTVGGVLVTTGGWPYIFLVNVPIGVAALLGIPHLRRLGIADEVDRATRFDPFGLALLSVGLTGLIYGTSEAPNHGWWRLDVAPYWIVGAGLLIAYLAWARRRDEPALELRLLRRFQSALAVGLCVLATVAMFGVLFLLPVLVQSVQGHGALSSGLVLFPQGIVMGLSTAIGRKLGGAWLRPAIIAGFAAIGATSLLLLLTKVDTPLWITALIMALRGFGVGLVIQPLLTGLLSGLPQRELTHANTLFNVGQRIGGSVGVSLLATLFSIRLTDHVLAALGLTAPVSGVHAGSLADVPAALRPVVTSAAVTAFHEATLVATAAAALGALGAIFVRPQPVATEPQAVGAGSQVAADT
jgi:EmrB/QacA subfamily drug resistance transporter